MGSCRLESMLTPGGDRFARRSAWEMGVQLFVKLLGVALKRAWKLKGTLRALKPNACTNIADVIGLLTLAPIL